MKLGLDHYSVRSQGWDVSSIWNTPGGWAWT
jgi:hypothetical protein